ncbi:MAG: transcription antitermination protein NusB [Bacteroidetes bacterium]|nr:transcription antitermination protein NusB [Bacteroidota bacterium]
MLSRRQLRIKVLQAIYAYIQLENNDLALGEKELMRSINKLQELFIYQLSFIIEIFDFARKMIEQGKLKMLPADEDINPNTKFIDNKVISQFIINRDYNKKTDQLKISWKDEEEMVRRVFQSIRQSQEYKEYMESEQHSYQEDKDILLELFRKYIIPYESLEGYYEEKSIYWASDYPVINIHVIKCIKDVDETWNEHSFLPSSRDEDNEDEALDFARQLFLKTILKGNEYEKMIAEKALNWESERIALLDMILLKMAISEIIDFPSIPIKVSFNEYIEISKEYSTPKSKVFINGILDKLIAELREKNMIHKSGRGLVE